MKDLEGDNFIDEDGDDDDKKFPDVLSGGLRRRTPSTMMMALPKELVRAKNVIKDTYPMVNYSPPVWDHEKRQTALVVIDVAGDLESLQNILSSCPRCHFRIVNSKLMLVYTDKTDDDDDHDDHDIGNKKETSRCKLGFLAMVMALMIFVIGNVLSRSNLRILLD